MSEGLIRVRDFAKACGCTPQNIYGHLKTYAAELEGHTHQGKGRQGVFLDEYAQEFLRSVMYPKELGDNALMEEINMLRAQLLQMGVENTRLASKLASTEGERDRALLDAGQYQKALTASQEAEEAQQARIEELTGENATLAVRAHEAEAMRADTERKNEILHDEIKLLKGDVHRLMDDLTWAETPWWKKIGKKQPRRDWHSYYLGKTEFPEPVEDPEE